MKKDPAKAIEKVLVFPGGRVEVMWKAEGFFGDEDSRDAQKGLVSA